jgi:hypothetical protein
MKFEDLIELWFLSIVDLIASVIKKIKIFSISIGFFQSPGINIGYDKNPH